MQYYFPDKPAGEERLSVIPAGKKVFGYWQNAFRVALLGEGVCTIPEGPAVVYVLEIETASQQAHVLNGCILRVPVPVSEVLEIDVDAWILSAVQEKQQGSASTLLQLLQKQEADERHAPLQGYIGPWQMTPKMRRS